MGPKFLLCLSFVHPNGFKQTNFANQNVEALDLAAHKIRDLSAFKDCTWKIQHRFDIILLASGKLF